MPRNPRIKVYFNSTLHHFSQLIAGLEYLSQNKEIDLEYFLDLGCYPLDIFRIEYNGLRVFVDMADNSRIYESLYNESDFYIKRMLLKSDYQERRKLIPYGFYYPVYYQNSYLKWLFLKNKKFARYSVKYWKLMSEILNIKDSIAVNEISELESKPSDSRTIIFRARLWNPENNNEEWKKRERMVLNNERIEVNRILKTEFNSDFIGGILKDKFSEENCPDLILPQIEYHRKSYIKALKKSSIGIVNQGLEDSIGAKLGEYLANGLAVITSPIHKFQLHGDFRENQNYLSYSSVEQCIEIVKHLHKDDNFRKNIQNNNFKYYHQYLQPGKKMKHIFALIENSINC